MSRSRRPRGKNRPKRWHRGEPEAQRARDPLPDVGSGADPTAGAPAPPRRVGGRNRGDAL